MISLEDNGASDPLIIAAVWTAMIQFGMLIVGTFIIKRFSTPFSIGFLLGLVMFVAQQHLMLSITFWHTQFGSMGHNMVFSNLSFGLFVAYSFFALILNNYREDIMVAPIDAKGLGGMNASRQREANIEADEDA